MNNIIKKHNIKWNWVKGHSGNRNNEKCHILAKRAAKNPTFVDYGYVLKNIKK